MRYTKFLFVFTGFSLLGCRPSLLIAMTDRYNSEKYLQRYFNYAGDTEPSEKLRRWMKEVHKEFVTQRRLPTTHIIHFKELSAQVADEWRKKGINPLYNACSNGKNVVHVHSSVENLTEGEAKQLLAHEVAHMVTNTNTKRNLHCLLDTFNKAALLGVPSSVLVGISGMCLYEKVTKKQVPLTMVTKMVAFPFALYLGVLKTFLHVEDAQQNPCGLHYSFLKKAEEVQCDLIAGFTMPGGFKNGKALYKRFLEKEGDTCGADGDHPCMSTRIWYHDLLSRLKK